MALRLVAAVRDRGLPPDVLEDWRVHPLTLAWLLNALTVSPGTVLDVGAGTHLTLSCALAGRVPTLFSVDRRAPLGPVALVHSVAADAAWLPFSSGTINTVVSRMFFGAPISQTARKALACAGDARDEGKHAAAARTHEHAIWRELRRISVAGALHLHHVLERRLYSNPADAGLQVLWGLDDGVELPPTPAREHGLAAFLHQLSGVILLRAV